MKKIFSLVISVVLLFCCTSCIWMADLRDKYKEYELIDLDVANATVIYNGIEYDAYSVTRDPKWSHRDGFRLNGEQVIVAKEFSVSTYCPLYVSADDVEENILVAHNGVIYAAKKDFTLPQIEKDPLSSVYIQSIPDETEKVAVIESTTEGFYLRDFMEFEKTFDYQEGTSKRDGQCRMSCVFEEYQYLRWVFISVAWIDGEIYCLYNNLGDLAKLESGYYKVKTEYQATFKTAIEELNKMQL